jgi:hypothetical protein
VKVSYHFHGVIILIVVIFVSNFGFDVLTASNILKSALYHAFAARCTHHSPHLYRNDFVVQAANGSFRIRRVMNPQAVGVGAVCYLPVH